MNYYPAQFKEVRQGTTVSCHAYAQRMSDTTGCGTLAPEGY